MEFYFKNKYEKIVHLVGFIIRMYHGARPSECQTRTEVSAVDYFIIRNGKLGTCNWKETCKVNTSMLNSIKTNCIANDVREFHLISVVRPFTCLVDIRVSRYLSLVCSDSFRFFGGRGEGQSVYLGMLIGWCMGVKLGR